MDSLTRQNVWRWLGALAVIVLLLAGCASAESEPVAPPATPRALGGSSDTAPESVASVASVSAETDTPAPLALPSPTATLPATNTPTPPPDATPTPSPAPTATPDPNITPTATSAPTATPTSVPQQRHILPQYEIEGKLTPVPPLDVPSRTTNILLLGQDSADFGDGGLNTDTLIILSINHELKTASMMSLPRDLYVQIPSGSMRRINTAIYGGIQSLKNTILYNLGIEIHYYAKVDFYAFQDIIDAIGGITVINSCSLTDWRLKSPELDIEDEDNWEQYTLDAGVHVMDGDLALWYARSRKSTSDFDRGRRQQQILRAMLDQSVEAGLIRQAPEFWSIFQERVETDLDIGRILQLAALAPSVRENGIQSIYLAGDNVTAAQTEDGYQVQLVNWDVMQNTLQRLYLPPALNRSTRPPITVEIINASGDPVLPILTVENLRWHGFVPIISDVQLSEREDTHITYFGDNFKGSYNWLLSWIMDQRESQLNLDDSTGNPFDYRIILGADYDPCRPELFAPQPYLTATQ